MNKRCFLSTMLAALALMGYGEDLVFDVSGAETYSEKIGASCEKIVKNGVGTLTLTSTEDAEFVGTVEVNAGILKINRIGNLGNPSAIVVAEGATLDLSGSETTRGNQPWCPSLTMGGSGCAGATGALVRNRGCAWDRMFQNVTLSADTTIDFGVETSFGYGTLNLDGHDLTKTGTGEFQLSKRGNVVGSGNIVVEGTVILENIDMSAGDPEKNCIVQRALIRWWTSRYDKPINWKLKCERNATVMVSDTTGGGFDSARLWTGPIESDPGIALTNTIYYANATVTYSGNVNLGGAFNMGSQGAVRMNGSSVSIASLDMRSGYLQLSPPAGSVLNFAKSSLAYGSLDAICPGSTLTFGGELATRFRDALTAFRGGMFSIGGETKIGSNGFTNTWDIADGAKLTALAKVSLGYSISTAAGHSGTLSVRGEGSELRIANPASFVASRTANTEETLNVSGGAVFASPRLTVTTKDAVDSASFYVNADGGVFKPTFGYGWTGSDVAKSGYEPTAFTLFEGGATVDLAECWADNVGGGKEGARTHSSFSFPLTSPDGGRRIASISLPADEEFAATRFASVPPVRITGCTGASAYLDVDPLTRLAKAIVVTSKGWSLTEDATATVTVLNAQTGKPQATYACAIVPEDVPADGWKGLTVIGASGSCLMLNEANTYRGPTTARANADVRFMVQDGRPLGSGLIVEKGSTVRFNNTDQSTRPIPFIQGGGTIQSFSSTISSDAIRVTTAELLSGDFIKVNGGLVLPANTVIKVVDPENLDVQTFGKARQIVSATTLTLPECGLSGFVVDAGTGSGNPWRVKCFGEKGLALCPPPEGFILTFR